MLIHSPRQLLATVPHLLGFHPADSLVLVVMNDAQIELVARFDLDGDVDVDLVRNTLRRVAESRYVVITYGATSRAPSPADTVIAQLRDFLLLDSLCVKSGRWRSYLCEDPGCCPVDGREVDDEADPLVTSLITAGSAPFANREQVVAALAPATLTPDEQEARGTVVTAAAAHGVPHDPSVDSFAALLDVLTAPAPHTWEQRMVAYNALRDFRLRDALLRHLLDHDDQRVPVRSGLFGLAPYAPHDAQAPVATTLAGCAWLDGNGALAQIAIERALDADPGYSLARLLDRALRHGVPPSVWADSLSAVTVDECLAGAA